MTKAKRHIRRIGILVIILLLLATGIIHAYAKPLPTLVATTKAPAGLPSADVSLPWPSYGESAFGAVGYGVLASTASQTALPTASVAKIMTALAVLREKPLALGEQGPTITLTQADVDSYNKYVNEDGSVVKVAIGEQLTEYQALQALLLPSANNIAETLARWAFGSIDAYTTYANQYAKTLNLTSMQITDPSGFLPSTVSSAHDLTLLGETAITNPVIAQIVDQLTANIPVEGDIKNVNALLGQEGTIGIKTGNSDQDTGAYLFAAKQTIGTKTITIVGTIMNGPDLGTALYDSLPIIETAAKNFIASTITKAGESVGSYVVPWQGTVPVTVEKDVSVLQWKGSAITTSLDLPRLQAPLSAGQSAGLLTIHNSLDNTDTSVAVVLKQAISKPGFWWRIEHSF